MSTYASPYDPKKLVILSIVRAEVDLVPNFGEDFNKTVLFDGMVRFTRKNILTYVVFDRCLTIHPDISTKLKVSIVDRKILQDFVKNPTAYQVTNNISFSLWGIIM